MKLVRTPAIASSLWPRRQWAGDRSGRHLYLTFDDGPTPGVTDRILDELDRVGARATFFVVGAQARRHPELLREIVARGHTVGNHTDTHVNGFATPSVSYLADVEAAQSTIAELLGEAPTLFRPPYGRLRGRDARELGQRYQIVMWEVLGYDWRSDLTAEAVAQNVISRGRPGSIVVLHDSQKAAERVMLALPTILNFFRSQRYRFDSLPT